MIPDPTLGISVNFPTETFNNAIRFAMQMAAPMEEYKRVTFIMPVSGLPTYWKNGNPVNSPRVDRDGNPLDAEIERRDPVPEEIQVDCAWEIVGGGGDDETPVGAFQQTRLVVTLLEEQYQEIVGCQAVRYNGDDYLYAYEPDNYGLFDAGVHTLIFTAKEET